VRIDAGVQQLHDELQHAVQRRAVAAHVLAVAA
jgi:coproporphyrinogen III oxidase-like Fe-S oxidoreductase